MELSCDCFTSALGFFAMSGCFLMRICDVGQTRYVLLLSKKIANGHSQSVQFCSVLRKRHGERQPRIFADLRGSKMQEIYPRVSAKICGEFCCCLPACDTKMCTCNTSRDNPSRHLKRI